MRISFRLARGARATAGLTVLSCVLAIPTGCGPSTLLAGSGMEVRPPSGWVEAPLDRWPVPGTPLAAWSGPTGESLVVSRSLPIPGGTAESVGRALTTRLSYLPGLSVVDRSTATVAGRPASRVEVVAPGTGDRLAPTGLGHPVAPEGRSLAPTRRVTITIPRSGDTLALTWHAPESAAEKLAEAVEATLGTIRLGEDAPASPAY
ncbi:MAG: hypothetical protein AB7I30_22020 [Isosphaeraceae bacterium]